MNIAFQAIILFFLILPGLLLRSTYNGRISKELVLPENYPPFSREAFRVVIFAIFLHVAWVSGANVIGSFADFKINLDAVFYLLGGNYSNHEEYSHAINSIVFHPIKVLIYFLSIYGFAYLLGFAAHTYIRKNGLDKRRQFFRFNNEWHYLLSGEVLEFPEVLQSPKTIDFVMISAAVEVGQYTYLYKGLLVNWYLDNKGNLDTLVLERAYRREIKDDREDGEANKPLHEDERYYRIEGNYFILNYKNVKNLGIEYVSITEKEPATLPANH